MIVDLFSHKIHSSGDEWPDKLAELAAIFGEFDGQLYDRAAFEERLQQISPRASYVAAESTSIAGGRRDLSKFRDEYSAYPAYLGIYYLESSPAGWVVRISETTRRFLLCEEPDVASFLRLQLCLLQYPNAMGAAYHNSSIRIQANVRDKTLEYIRDGVHLSPVRLIAIALRADATLRGTDVLNASVTFKEVYGLANAGTINRLALPAVEDTAIILDDIRTGNVDVPVSFESRFHLLRHTEMFAPDHGEIRLRETVNTADRNHLLHQMEAICNITSQFDGFDGCTTGALLEEAIVSGGWGKYFDGVRMLPSNIVDALTNDQALSATPSVEPVTAAATEAPIQPAAETFPLRERANTPSPAQAYNRRREMADPELTRIKMQRRNLAHKELIDKMDSWLRQLGAQPKENDHIDLFAKIPGDGSFIFEMKSGGESILDQIRKGLSQLYEYRYRYREALDDPHISLCLVLPGHPSAVPWVTKYLCEDREINMCWFDQNGNLVWPELCTNNMQVLRLQ
jgi:hypothetical protein